MSIRIGKYDFEGLYTLIDHINNKAGVYVIVCKALPFYSVIDCDESTAIKRTIENHVQKDCWIQKCSGTLVFAVLYTPDLQEKDRAPIEQEIRRTYNVSCEK